jgi:hypothetical protein
MQHPFPIARVLSGIRRTRGGLFAKTAHASACAVFLCLAHELTFARRRLSPMHAAIRYIDGHGPDPRARHAAASHLEQVAPTYCYTL